MICAHRINHQLQRYPERLTYYFQSYPHPPVPHLPRAERRGSLFFEGVPLNLPTNRSSFRENALEDAPCAQQLKHV